MIGTIAPLAMALALTAPGGLLGHRHADGQPMRVHNVPLPSAYPYDKHPPCGHSGCFNCEGCGNILPPGPGYGWGFPNGAPDGYGWVDYGEKLPISADRTPDYFFRRYFAFTPQVMFFPTYYNNYLQRGQRYIPYTNCGGGTCCGWHPFSGPPMGSSYTPPDQAATNARTEPVLPPPVFQGRVETPPSGRETTSPSRMGPTTLPPTMAAPEDRLGPTGP